MRVDRAVALVTGWSRADVQEINEAGLLVVARSARAYDSLVEQLSSRTVERCYSALVWGVPASRRGIIDAPIGRSEARRTRMAIRSEGRPARTAYVVERTWPTPLVAL